LRKQQVDFYDLIITAGLSKTSAEYKNPQAHAYVADLIKKRSPGAEPHIGDRVPYVIVAGEKKSKRFERAEDPLYALENDLNLDTNYYVEQQMMGPLTRIFEPIFGEKETQKRLTSGDANVRIVKISSEEKGLTRYFHPTTPCVGCGSQLPLDTDEAKGLICPQCEPQRIDHLFATQKEQRRVQLEYSRIWTNCQSCQGSMHREVLCQATDCPVFYKRIALCKEMDKVQGRVKALSLDW
jgi:DNA polymerase delta subunit 1